MYKNQLQELAQRSCFNLPSYACIREGPDHAPRFKATVNFNGEVFESPGYFSTLRQAEHAAAEVALKMLSKGSAALSLASKILDETGVCKNLLQETAQRAGISLPTYTTVRSGPGHLPMFTCTVEVAGMQFSGDAAKTKKQAEKNAAMTAWSALKQYASKSSFSKGTSSASFTSLEINDEQEQNTIVRALATANGKDNRCHSSPAVLGGRANYMSLGMSYSPEELNTAAMYSRRMVGHGSSSEWDQGAAANQPPVHRHTNIPIKPGMAYQPRPRQPYQQHVPIDTNMAPPMAYRRRSHQFPAAGVIGSSLPGPGAPGRAIPSVVSASMSSEHQADEESWLRGEPSKIESAGRPHKKYADPPSASLWSGAGDYWPGGMGGMGLAPQNQGMGLAPPVTVRTVIPVHATPRRLRDEDEDDINDPANDVYTRTRQVLSQLSL